MNEFAASAIHILLGMSLGLISFWYFLFSAIENKKLLQKHKAKIYVLLFASLILCFMFLLLTRSVHEGRPSEENNRDLTLFIVALAGGMLASYILLKKRRWEFYEEIKKLKNEGEDPGHPHI